MGKDAMMVAADGNITPPPLPVPKMYLSNPKPKNKRQTESTESLEGRALQAQVKGKEKSSLCNDSKGVSRRSEGNRPRFKIKHFEGGVLGTT